ncbi:MAG: hypothetical protein CBC73_00150 [Flavobacteriales bacterium TMED113]|nr:MAG: hypothetical protein CBC73_00150 [Flavobacteriales bacterium TMED113]
MDKISINIIDESGKKHILNIDVHPDMNLMEVLRSYDFMEGACGGMCLCATCHCYIVSDDKNILIKNEEEDDMLDQLFSLKENSRLACQIPLSKELDNLTIQIASAD